jgi:hypothetical protein
MATFNPRMFTDPDRLRHVSSARLGRFFAPWNDYLRERGFEFPSDAREELDFAALAAVLMTPTHATPRDMIDALYYVHETASDEDMDELIAAVRH